MVSTTEIIVGMVIVLLLLGVMLGVRAYLRNRRRTIDRRLHGRDPAEAALGELGIIRADDSGSGLLTARMLDTKPPGFLGRIDAGFENLVARTGLSATADQTIGFMALIGTVLGIVLYFWKGDLLLAVVGFGLGMLIPFVVLWFLSGNHRRKIQNQLPDAYYMMARSLRTGQSLEQAIELVGTKGPQPLNREFQRAARQINLGLAIPAALQTVARRVRLLDFDAFVSTITIYIQTGGNLPMLLDRLGASTRDHNQFRGYFLAATAQARITAFFIGAAAPALLVGYLLFEPEHIQAFFGSGTGGMVLVGVVVLEIIGILWLWRLLKIEY